MYKTRKEKKNKAIIKVSISETLEDSNILTLWKGQTKLSRYNFTIISKTNRSLNKNPV